MNIIIKFQLLKYLKILYFKIVPSPFVYKIVNHCSLQKLVLKLCCNTCIIKILIEGGKKTLCLVYYLLY